MSRTSGAGRPRRSSRRTLEDAAAELFLEQTYEGTTIDEITSRAGVSRNTFFNYFESKSDILWVDFDESIRPFERILRETDTGLTGMGRVRAALIRVAEDHPRTRVPWALTQYELMGTREVLMSSGFARFLRVSQTISVFLTGRNERDGTDAVGLASAAAASVTAAAASGAAEWAAAGVHRRPLPDYVDRAIRPVCDGFDARD